MRSVETAAFAQAPAASVAAAAAIR